MKKIAVLTSGGDAPGMNNAIRAIVKSAKKHNIETFLIYEGFKGLVDNNMVDANEINMDKYISRGGTCIYSSRFPEFKEPKVREIAVQNLKDKGIEAVIVIGGDGSFAGAQKLHELGIKAIGLPGTIDNDIASTSETIGYDTALNTIVESLDKVRDTSLSHRRCIVVEVMGNRCGDLALYSGLASGAEIVVTSDYKMNEDEIAELVKIQTKKPFKRSILVVVSEKLFPSLQKLADKIESVANVSTRAMSLGHTQRGGNPTARERINASLLGIKAVEKLINNESGIVLGFNDLTVKSTPILDALKLTGPSRTIKQDRAKFINELNQS